jgi:transposase InsO family protein
VAHLEADFAASERRACTVTGQHRSTQRYAPRPRDGEDALLARLRELVRENPRRGCRYLGKVLRNEGWPVNHKRVHRLWKQEGYKVPTKRHKKRAIGTASNACDKRCATAMNDVWTWDFIQDRLVDGRVLKCLVIVDEYTRECLELRVARSLTGTDVLDALARLAGERGAPKHVRSDNGSEFIAREVKHWLASLGVETLYIEPGAPWQNGYAESFNSRLRDEFLEMNYFNTLAEAKELARRWKEHYNTQRLHSSLGYTTPAEFARRCGATGSASLRSAAPAAPHRQGAADTPPPTHALS